ncbi:MAG: glutamine-hydrolyzing carbamoyl-phosphate synthase small subunit [Candidatus Margulisbacteria bacterium]|nr:glutamine-hydrolyzing carbamoyl-phosphate synthase small subunit [Candidatus Margulisiibacteriota bacterium]
MKAKLVLEDGTVFEGESFGAEGEKAGEVIFNTQIIGYQEILTDPAYAGQIVAMGYPHIGNYGINDRLFESDSTHALALVVKEYSKVYSNWQAKGSLDEFMKKHGVIGIEGVDTRDLTLHIRDNGEMKGIVSTKDLDSKSLLQKIKAHAELKHETRNGSTSSPSREKSRDPKPETISKAKTVIINIGMNKSTLNAFPGAAVVAHNATAEKIMEMKPQEVIISSGPGDPRRLTGLVEEVKKLVGKVKIYGIQNGACVLALALGCSINRMKVGHHGMNHPVVDPKSGRGEISMQNHSYVIEKMPAGSQTVHVNLNDKTIEKFQTKDGLCVGTLYFPIDERSKLASGYKYV